VSALPDDYREHNRAAMDAAGVTDAARRGFHRATCYGSQRIKTISRHGRRYALVVELYEGSMTTHCYVIGPRGGVRRFD
jgi:hypothetical protein